jgi:hypothetical protein
MAASKGKHFLKDFLSSENQGALAPWGALSGRQNNTGSRGGLAGRRHKFTPAPKSVPASD